MQIHVQIGRGSNKLLAAFLGVGALVAVVLLLLGLWIVLVIGVALAAIVALVRAIVSPHGHDKPIVVKYSTIDEPADPSVSSDRLPLEPAGSSTKVPTSDVPDHRDSH